VILFKLVGDPLTIGILWSGDNCYRGAGAPGGDVGGIEKGSWASKK